MSTVVYNDYIYSTILNISNMKKMVDFNAFAEWYSGEQSAAAIIEYFDDVIGEDVSALVGTEVELEVVPETWNGGYECRINGEQLVLDAIYNYFECQ